MPQVAESALRVSHSRIRELAEIAMQMDGVYRLYFGESNLPTPDYIKRAASQALADGHTFYTSNAGLPSLRRELSRYYAATQNVELDPVRNFVVTASGVQALNLAIRCVLNPGDEAIVITPAWPNGSSIIQMANATPVEVPYVLNADRYAVDFDALEAAVTPRTRLLMYISPSNPLGWVATDEEQSKLLDFTRRHGLWLLADEVYDRLSYGSPDGEAAPSILRKTSDDDAVIVAQSFSKAWCMTGWRVGWLVSRPDLVERGTVLNEFVISHAASFSQKAAETALSDGEPVIREMLQTLRDNRDYCRSMLQHLPGVTVPSPDGAFYLFPSIDGLEDSFALCKEMLLTTRVGVAPGVAFGKGGEGSIRICYAADRTVLEPAMQRIAEFLSMRAKARASMSGR